MKLSQEIFAIKLYEMEQEYGRLQSRLRSCEQEDHKKIREELEKAKDDYKEHALALQRSAEGSRSLAVAELAQAQLEFSRKMQNLLKGRLEKHFRSEESNTAEDRAEAATLYAEYAIDLAAQTMRYALVASLAAIDLQMNFEEEKGEA